MGDEEVQFFCASNVEDVDDGPFEAEDFLHVEPIVDGGGDEVFVYLLEGVLDDFEFFFHLRLGDGLRDAFPVARGAFEEDA